MKVVIKQDHSFSAVVYGVLMFVLSIFQIQLKKTFFLIITLVFFVVLFFANIHVLHVISAFNVIQEHIDYNGGIQDTEVIFFHGRKFVTMKLKDMKVLH